MVAWCLWMKILIARHNFTVFLMLFLVWWTGSTLIKYSIREEASFALAGFLAAPLSWSNLNLTMLVFVILPLLLIIFNNNFYLFHFAHEELVFGDFDNISRQYKTAMNVPGLVWIFMSLIEMIKLCHFIRFYMWDTHFKWHTAGKFLFAWAKFRSLPPVTMILHTAILNDTAQHTLILVR